LIALTPLSSYNAESEFSGSAFFFVLFPDFIPLHTDPGLFPSVRILALVPYDYQRIFLIFLQLLSPIKKAVFRGDENGPSCFLCCCGGNKRVSEESIFDHLENIFRILTSCGNIPPDTGELFRTFKGTEASRNLPFSLSAE